MKVLHVIDALGVGGGAEHSLADMLPRLQERDIDSSVVTLIPRKGGLGERLRNEGFDVAVLSSRSWPGRVRELRARAASSSPDLVHSTLFNASLVARFAGVGSQVPLINSLVNTTYDPVRLSMADIVPWKMRLMAILDGFTARHTVTHVHALTDAVKAEAVGVLGIAPQRITVIPRGRSRAALGEATKDRRADTRRRLGVEPTTPLFLNVGRQDSQKCHAELIRAFSSVLNTHPDAVLLVAGRDGDASTEIGDALSEVDAGDSIRMLGHRTDVNDLYVAADVFVFPSRYEGLGCSLLEAMALRAPIVGSDAPAIAEVLRHGELGDIVARGDIAALGAAMCGLLEQPERRELLADRAEVAFDDVYDLDKVADRTAEMYKDVVSRSRGA